ncbi:hypothetical protein BC829DRAFT_402556 [Chytridium lagenaria]|nr:hypothetical protein BC829DRAFT_402556 [Chytridium lagenaria]
MTSAIAPSVVRDLVGSIATGIGLGYGFWYLYHEPSFEEWKRYDAQVAAEIKPIHDAWRAAQKNE